MATREILEAKESIGQIETIVFLLFETMQENDNRLIKSVAKVFRTFCDSMVAEGFTRSEAVAILSNIVSKTVRK